MDAIALEPQFVDHLAPVWRALPEEVRGSFLTDAKLVDHAQRKGLEAVPIDADKLRRSSAPPKADPGDGPTAFTVSIGDIKAARRLGYRRFAFMEHGIGQAYVGPRGTNGRHPSYPGGLDREDVGLFLCPNEYSAALWRAAYPSARVEIVGSPRLDDLPAREPDGRTTIALSFHWPASVAPEAGTALGHYMKAPDGGRTGGYIRELAERYTVLFHAHPKGEWPQRIRHLADRLGVEFVPDFEDVCRRADLYACDNSSTLYEFAATGRPVLVLNCPEYRKNVEHGLRFWDAAKVGINVFCPCDLVALAGEALRDDADAQREREEALGIVYGQRSNGAASAVTATLDFLAVRQTVAA